MFQLINENHKGIIEKFILEIGKVPIEKTANAIENIIRKIHKDIPEKKRISYGRYSIIKKMGLEIYPMLEESGIDVYSFGKKIFDNTDNDQFVRSFAIQLISIYGEKTKNLDVVLADFENAATDENWEMRECSAGFIRKLIKKYPQELRQWYLKSEKSENELLRRFTIESFRPVADNQWFKKNPDFCFEVLENLYTESKEYPRTSVGNSLSDWFRTDKERVFEIIEKLVKSGNKNSYWIAYRACRNIVKTETNRVMDLLGVDEYKYKKRVHFRMIE